MNISRTAITFAAYDYAAFAFLIVGIALALLQFFNLAFRLKINARAMTDAIIRLVQSDKTDRAIKLCELVPAVPYARGLKGALTVLLSGQSDTISLAAGFNQELGGARADPFQSITMPTAGKTEFPSLDKRMSKIRIYIFLALVAAWAGLGLHYLTGSRIPHHYAYGPAGAVSFLFLLSMRETFAIPAMAKRQFARFCDAVQGIR